MGTMKTCKEKITALHTVLSTQKVSYKQALEAHARVCKWKECCEGNMILGVISK